MSWKLFRAAFVWGFVLWAIGYVMGIVLFPFVPSSLLGWVIMPIGTFITVLVLLKWITLDSLQAYIFVAGVWLLIAVICDYFLLVQVFKPSDGYYKVDVYIYYFITFVLPVVAGWKKADWN